MTNAVRGQIYHVDIGGDRGRHYYVVVSGNERNRLLNSVLGAMITSRDKSHVDTAVLLTPNDTIQGGYIVADTIDELFDYELDQHVGAVSPATLANLNVALKKALGLND